MPRKQSPHKIARRGMSGGKKAAIGAGLLAASFAAGLAGNKHVRDEVSHKVRMGRAISHNDRPALEELQSPFRNELVSGCHLDSGLAGYWAIELPLCRLHNPSSESISLVHKRLFPLLSVDFSLGSVPQTKIASGDAEKIVRFAAYAEKLPARRTRAQFQANAEEDARRAEGALFGNKEFALNRSAINRFFATPAGYNVFRELKGLKPLPVERLEDRPPVAVPQPTSRQGALSADRRGTRTALRQQNLNSGNRLRRGVRRRT